MATGFEASSVSCVVIVINRFHENAQVRYQGSLEIPIEADPGMVGWSGNHDNKTNILDLRLFRLVLGLLCSAVSLDHCKPTLRVLEIGAGTSGTVTNTLLGLGSSECIQNILWALCCCQRTLQGPLEYRIFHTGHLWDRV